MLSIAAAACCAALLTLVGCHYFIKRMRSLHYGQQVRIDGPASHTLKAGTPTMGGAVFIAAGILVSAAFAGRSPHLYPALLVTAGCGLIGFLDDFFKVARSRSLGLKARSKLAAEVLLVVVMVLLLRHFQLYSSRVALPFSDYEVDFGVFYPLLILLLVIGFSNSVNLTDGIDGLAAGTSLVAFAAFLLISWRLGLAGLSVFCAALAGCCIGFLFYNRHPARLFMGDTGSLALGGALAAVAVLAKAELYLLLIGAVFVIEALSVMIQVAVFQLAGRRVFLMSPLHHHFELKGWSERRVVRAFYGAALVFAVLGTMAYFNAGLSGP